MGKQSKSRKKYFKKEAVIHQKDEKIEVLEDIKTAGKEEEEKEKIKAVYGLQEKQLSRYIKDSLKHPVDPAVDLFQRLELRLDNIVFRLGFAASRKQAREFIVMGFIFVNGKKKDRPQYNLKPRDHINISNEPSAVRRIRNSLKRKPQDIPPWLEIRDETGLLKHYPGKREIRKDIDFNRIITAFI